MPAEEDTGLGRRARGARSSAPRRTSTAPRLSVTGMTRHCAPPPSSCRGGWKSCATLARSPSRSVRRETGGARKKP
eukprot:2809404-Pyramimonas_sp.AAC.1